MPLIALFNWSLYTLPTSTPMTDIEGDTHSNHPDSVDYNPSAPTWIGQTFTFNGGSSTQIEINDDDDLFEDAYVETGGAQTLAQDVTINGVTYLAGAVVQNEFSMLDAADNEIFVMAINHVNAGFLAILRARNHLGETNSSVWRVGTATCMTAPAVFQAALSPTPRWRASRKEPWC